MTSTVWHITFGMYGARLHGGDRSTVDRSQNQLNQPPLGRNAQRERFERSILRADPVTLAPEQRELIQNVAPVLCKRGGWYLHDCAAEVDHVHIIITARSNIHGKQIRALLKRWFSQALNDRFGRRTWWAEGGSNRVVHDERYLHNVHRYVRAQGVREAGETG